jgi:hypothetical protein
MAKTVRVKIGDEHYEVPHLDIGQFEELAVLWDRRDAERNPLDEEGKPLSGAALLKHILAGAQIVLRDAVPPIADVRKLRCDISELRAAVETVMLMGRKASDAGEAAAGASPAA